MSKKIDRYSWFYRRLVIVVSHPLSSFSFIAAALKLSKMNRLVKNRLPIRFCGLSLIPAAQNVLFLILSVAAKLSTVLPLYPRREIHCPCCREAALSAACAVTLALHATRTPSRYDARLPCVLRHMLCHPCRHTSLPAPPFSTSLFFLAAPDCSSPGILTTLLPEVLVCGTRWFLQYSARKSCNNRGGQCLRTAINFCTNFLTLFLVLHYVCKPFAGPLHR